MASDSKILKRTTYIVLFCLSLVVSYVIFAWLTRNNIGFPWGFFSSSVDGLVVITGVLSILMIVVFFSHARTLKAIIYFSIFLGSYSILFFAFQEPVKNGSFGYNFYLCFIFIVVVSLAGGAVLWNSSRNPILPFLKGSRKVGYVSFVTGVMWLSPLIGEMLHQQRDNIALVLGGNGFSDILFSAGFSVFASSSIYCTVLFALEKFESSHQENL